MRWFRRFVIFVLGIILIVNNIYDSFHILEFTVGIIMVGVIPIDYIVDLMMRPSTDQEQLDRLEEVMKRHDEEPPPKY